MMFVTMATNILIPFLVLCGTWWAHAAVDCRVTGSGRFADLADENCKNYTLCIYVKITDSYFAYNTVCPGMSVFNPQISKCTSPTNYICNTGIIASKPSPSIICTFDGYIADPKPTNCSTYIQCVKINGVFTQLRHSCPGTTYFNPISTLCESNYNCAEFTCSSPGRIADKSDITCRKYYYCVQLFNGTYAQFKYSCPAATVFNPQTELCTTQYACS